MHESEEYMKIKTGVGANIINRNMGTEPFFSDITSTIAYNTHCHYIDVRNAIEMKEVQQFTFESNGPHGQPHCLATHV